MRCTSTLFGKIIFVIIESTPNNRCVFLDLVALLRNWRGKRVLHILEYCFAPLVNKHIVPQKEGSDGRC